MAHPKKNASNPPCAWQDARARFNIAAMITKGAVGQVICCIASYIVKAQKQRERERRRDGEKERYKKKENERDGGKARKRDGK